jgi:hypothetical protein
MTSFISAIYRTSGVRDNGQSRPKITARDKSIPKGLHHSARRWREATTPDLQGDKFFNAEGVESFCL